MNRFAPEFEFLDLCLIGTLVVREEEAEGVYRLKSSKFEVDVCVKVLVGEVKFLSASVVLGFIESKRGLVNEELDAGRS